jgi:Na+-transporting NADH:ubiquinone oxidoreductase subunit NqrE
MSSKQNIDNTHVLISIASSTRTKTVINFRRHLYNRSFRISLILNIDIFDTGVFQQIRDDNFTSRLVYRYGTGCGTMKLTSSILTKVAKIYIDEEIYVLA